MKQENGFTLVELAIALMVIGLLIGGVLKGQELIENARITATMRQIKAYDTATMIFRNTYGALPGDLKKPNRIPNCNTNDGNLCGIAGNGNGKILYNDTSPAGMERQNFFPHLTKAGMIQGPEGGTAADMSIGNEKFFPEMPLPTSMGDVYFYVGYNSTSGGNWPIGHYYEFLGPACKHAAALDIKMDDGNPVRGMVHTGSDCYDVDADPATLEYDTSGTYAEIDIFPGF